MKKRLNDSEEEKVNLNIHGLSPLEAQVAEFAIGINQKAQNIPKRFVSQFLYDIDNLAQKRYSYFMHRSARGGRSWVMKDVRMKVEEYPLDSVFSPSDIMAGLPYDEKQITNALSRVHQQDGELDLYWLGNYSNYYIRLKPIEKSQFGIPKMPQWDLRELRLVSFREERDFRWIGLQDKRLFDFYTRIIKEDEIENIPKATNRFGKDTKLRVYSQTDLKRVIKGVWDIVVQQTSKNIQNNGLVDPRYDFSLYDYVYHRVKQKFKVGSRRCELGMSEQASKLIEVNFCSADFNLQRAEYKGKLIGFYDPFYLQRSQNQKFENKE